MRLLNDSLVHGLEHGHDTQVSHTNSHELSCVAKRMRCVNDIDSQDCTPAHVAITSLRHEVPDTQAKAVHQRKTTFLRRASARHTGVDGANIASALWLVRAIASVLWPGRAFASDLWLGRAYSYAWLCHHTSGHRLISAKRLHYVAREILQRCMALSPYLQARLISAKHLHSAALIGIKSLRGSNCQIATIRATIQMAPS